MQILITYIITTVVFFAIDMLWLGVIARNLYREKLGFILSENVNWSAAVIFYLIYIAGIIYFVIYPGMQHKSMATTALNGALLGMLCYATYDLTNMATIDKWPLQIVVIDILWGGVLTASVSCISLMITLKLFHQ